MKLLPKNIGILAFLGPFLKHKEMFEKMGVLCTAVKTLEDLDAVDALVIPGTEIASLHFALKELLPAIAERVKDGMPLLLTGEACVLLSEEENTALFTRKLHIKKYQKDSSKRFNEAIRLNFSDTKNFTGIFVRPPEIEKIPKNITVLADKESDGEDAVMIEKDSILACTFYPEFGSDPRIHEYFVTKI